MSATKVTEGLRATGNDWIVTGASNLYQWFKLGTYPAFIRGFMYAGLTRINAKIEARKLADALGVAR